MRWSVVALLLATAGVARAATLERVDVRRSPVLAVRLDVSIAVEPDVHTLPAADGLHVLESHRMEVIALCR